MSRKPNVEYGKQKYFRPEAKTFSCFQAEKFVSATFVSYAAKLKKICLPTSIQSTTLNDSRLKITNRAITGLSYCDIFKVCFSDIRYANQLQMKNILKVTVYG